MLRGDLHGTLAVQVRGVRRDISAPPRLFRLLRNSTRGCGDIQRPLVVPAIAGGVGLPAAEETGEGIEAAVRGQVRRGEEADMPFAHPVCRVAGVLELVGDEGPAQVDVVGEGGGEFLAVVDRQPPGDKGAPRLEAGSRLQVLRWGSCGGWGWGLGTRTGEQW